MIRIRFTFAKKDTLRYISNLELQKLWERICRRAHLPLSYSQGFHPQPKINIACPLPLGIEGHQELIDIWFEKEIDVKEIKALVEKATPPGMVIRSAETVELQAKPLQTLVESANYRVWISENITEPELSQRIQEILKSTSIIRHRRDKDYDLRPLILELDYTHDSIHPANYQLTMKLSAKNSATGRPDEVISALGFDPLSAVYERLSLELITM